MKPKYNKKRGHNWKDYKVEAFLKEEDYLKLQRMCEIDNKTIRNKVKYLIVKEINKRGDELNE